MIIWEANIVNREMELWLILNYVLNIFRFKDACMKIFQSKTHALLTQEVVKLVCFVLLYTLVFHLLEINIQGHEIIPATR